MNHLQKMPVKHLIFFQISSKKINRMLRDMNGFVIFAVRYFYNKL